MITDNENYRWDDMESSKIGRYAEDTIRQNFRVLNFHTYSSDIDDHGIDFIARRQSGPFLEIQVKGTRHLNYVFFKKAVFVPRENLFAAVVLFFEHQAPQAYLIPSTAWLSLNALFVEKNFGLPGQTSTPEWGMNLSQKNLPLLAPYAFHLTIQNLL